MGTAGIATGAVLAVDAQTRSSMAAAMIKMNAASAATLVGMLDQAADTARALTEATAGQSLDKIV